MDASLYAFRFEELVLKGRLLYCRGSWHVVPERLANPVTDFREACVERLPWEKDEAPAPKEPK